MLEALIRKESLPQSDKCAGDVICVKLKGHSDWGAMEKRVHAVVDWQDDNLEQKLLSSLNENKEATVIITPYKQEKKVSFGIDSLIVTKTRSTKYFDFDTGKQREKSQEQIELEFKNNKLNSIKLYYTNKPVFQIKKKDTNDKFEKIKILQIYVEQLRDYGVHATIIDGEIVMPEDVQVNITR